MNKEKVEKARDLIANVPDVYMENWFNDGTSCGTVGCIAGWVLLDAGLTKKVAEPSLFRHGFYTKVDLDQPCVAEALNAAGLTDPASRSNSAPGTTAARLLGLTGNERRRLFHLTHWPPKFHEAYTAAKNPVARKQAVVDRINHFLATNGEE